MDIPLLQLFLASVITFISINLLRPFAVSINLVDIPKGRKKHVGDVPLIGGISMFLGIVISILTSPYDLNQFSYFILVALIILIIGVLDDHRNISVSLRLFFQVLVGIIVVSAGDLSLKSLGNITGSGNLVLNQWGYFISVIAIILGMNAVNMADGIHGLAGGNSLITFVAILYLSIDSLVSESLLIVLLFCSVLPVFLIHNLCLGIATSKRIFMGDAGSMFIGLSIVWVLIDLSQGENKSFSPVTALWLFSVPIIDISSAILRRLTSGKSPFKADLFHIHHILLQLGFSHTKTLLLILFTSFIMAIIGILGEYYRISDQTMISFFIMICGIYIPIYMMLIKKIKVRI
jgi:UDP-GlcNAc:undecaprenyl-phosphate/decaprenyl-phosphate GlcNAc-1-phosphate transferase